MGETLLGRAGYTLGFATHFLVQPCCVLSTPVRRHFAELFPKTKDAQNMT